MFQTYPIALQQLLKDAHEGKLQLPDFQRSFVWSDDAIQSLIASVAKGYPIGAFLSLQTGGEVRFKPRLLEGVNGSRSSSPQELLLDGQQRLTSLYQALYSKRPVRTLNSQRKEVDRFYYLDIRKALSAGADVRDAIIGVPEDRIIRKNFGREVDTDLSTPEKEFENHAFPFDCVFVDMGGFRVDPSRGAEYWRKTRYVMTFMTLEKGLNDSIVGPLTAYEIPVITLDQEEMAGRRYVSSSKRSIRAASRSTRSSFSQPFMPPITSIFAMIGMDHSINLDRGVTQGFLALRV